MRILQLAPLSERVPPPAYGGTEAVVSLLADELVRLGHDVTLAASGDSTTTAHLHAVYHRSLRGASGIQDPGPYEWAHVGSALSRAHRFDVVHNHAGELAMALAGLLPTPMLTTAHCVPTEDAEVIWRSFRGAYNAISADALARLAPIAPCGRNMGYVHNAIDANSFPFSRLGGDDLLFLSRMSPEKGPQHAIEVARRCGMRLLLAGKVDEQDRRFFDEVIAGLIDGDQIVFLGEASAELKRLLYASARCLLFPIMWDEPFGLVMPEAMACGTPVIAFNRGSAPEVIDHGVTGFVVDTIDEMVTAVQRVTRIDRMACRREAEGRFSAQAMAKRYVAIYRQIVMPALREREPIAIDGAETEFAGEPLPYR
jgi:glycosyltransferase involved in cell wall biosynthesis